MMNPIPHPRVAVCDPSEISRIGIVHALERHGVRVLAEGPDVAAVGRRLEQAHDVVVLVDVSVRDFAASVAGLLERSPDVTIVATGVAADPETVLTALRSGARGYLTKDLPVKAWAGAIRGAVRGEAALSRSLTVHLIEAFRSQVGDEQLLQHIPSGRRLTRREWEILARIAEGTTNREVAGELHISTETVRSHVSNILAKLEAPNRAAAAAKFRQLQAAGHR